MSRSILRGPFFQDLSCTTLHYARWMSSPRRRPMMAHTLADALLGYLSRLTESRRDEVPDAALLQRFVGEREEAAYSALLRRHASLVWGVCWRLTGHVQEAEDAFQATFLVLARNASTVRNGESLASWLYGVAYRVATRARQRAARRHAIELQAASERTASADSSESWRELQAALDDEVARLPNIYRAPFVLCCLEQRSKREAAQLLGLPEGTLSSRLARSRKILRQRLARRGIALSALLTGLAVGRATAVSPRLIDETLRAAVTAAPASACGSPVETLAASAVPVKASTRVLVAGGLVAILLPIALGLALSPTPAE